MCVLQSTKYEGRFAFRFAKRANRSGATDIDGGRISLVHLKHAEGSILREQTPAPFVAEPKPKGKKTVEKLDQLIVKIDRTMKKSKVVALAEEGGHSTKYISQRDWSKIAEKLFNNPDNTFQNFDPNDPHA